MKQNKFNLLNLRKDLLPFRLHWFTRLRSTNDHAATLRRRHQLFAPAVVLTGHQLAGRGRGSNTWWSGTGSITATFILPADEHLAAHHVPLLAGLAIRSAIAEVISNDDVQLKWPNDLQHHRRKMAGLLCERLDKVDLIGLGLNVNINLRKVPKLLRERITSLQQITGSPINQSTALAVIARHLHQRLSHRNELSFDGVIREYDRHHALLHRRVTVFSPGTDPPITGMCEGLDRIGRLLVRDRQQLHRVLAGHVEAH